MSTTGKAPRRIKVVDGRFQYRTIAISLSVIVLGLLLFAGLTALYYVFARAEGKAPNPEILLVILPPLLLNDLAIMVVVIVVGVYTSHRVAGPVYRIAADIDRVLSGERRVRVSLRRNDALADLAEKVNQLIERCDDTRTG
jgi:nitrogen fixation/metabolism regulation signal transduction histidine kinase